MKPALLATAFALNLLLPALSLAAGCCQGFGAFELDGDWHADKNASGPKSVQIVHASFESSRDLLVDLNEDFTRRWFKKTGYKLTVNESHASTEAQARAILAGAEPDLISFDTPSAIDELATRAQLLPADWPARLPHGSSPFTTTVVFLVDRGNPKHIRDWSDLTTAGISVVTSDPRLSGHGQWNYFAAWTYAFHALGSPQKATDFTAQLYRNVQVLNSTGRGSIDTFVKKHAGDVLLVWESDAQVLAAQSTDRKLEVVTPSSSILVEPPVSYLDRNLEKHGNARITISFAKYLFNPEAQQIIARHHFRPRSTEIGEKYSHNFPPLQLFTVADEFGSWSAAVKQHFAAGGIYDRAISPAPAVAALAPASGQAGNRP